MNRDEKLQFQKETEDYFESKRVYDLFEKLLKELIINQPREPIDYLIDRLKKKDTKRIFITGSPGNDRKEIALFLAGYNNMTGISLGDLIQKEIDKKLELGRRIEKRTANLNLIDDDIILDIMKKELIQLEKENVSYLIEGFPRNRIQAMFLISVGLLPDNLFILSTSEHKIKERLLEKHYLMNGKPEKAEITIKSSLDECELNIKAVKDVFKGNYTDISTQNKKKSEIIEEIDRIIKFKNKTSASRKPARVLILAPPCSRKSKIASLVAGKYNLCSISTSDLLNKEIQSQNDNSANILRSMITGELVSDKYVEKLIEDRLYASDCMINGWILTGFPKNKTQLSYMLNHQNYFIKPSMIVMIDLEDDYIMKRANVKRIDPTTGKIYYIDTNEFSEVSSKIGDKLIMKNEDKPDVLKKRIDNWRNFLIACQDLKVLRLNGELSTEDIVKSISNALENDS